MNTEQIRQFVKNGAAWLDVSHPGWERKIDLSNLEMRDCKKCIIGQAVGDFRKTVAEPVDFVLNWSYENGFASRLPLPGELKEDVDEFWEKYYSVLDELWTEEVKYRFNLGLVDNG